MFSDNSLAGLSRRVARREGLALLMGGLAASLAACAAPPSVPAATAPPKPTAAAPAKPTAALAKPAATQPPAAAPTAAKAPQPWTMSYTGPQFFNAFVEIGPEKGIDREFGLNLKVEKIASGNATIKAVIAGENDAGSVGTSSLVMAIAEGAALTPIGSLFVKVPHVLAVRSTISSVKDLAGKTFAITAPGDFSHAVTLSLLAKHNVDASSIEWLTLAGGGEAARVQALLAGKIDAGAITPEFIPELRKDPQVRVLLEYANEVPEYVRQAFFVNNKNLVERPELVQAYVLTLMKSARYAIDHRAETIGLAAKILGVPADALGETFDQHAAGVIQPDFLVTQAQMSFMQDLNVKLEVQKSKVPVEKLLDLRFQQEAMKQLGPYKPAR